MNKQTGVIVLSVLVAAGMAAGANAAVPDPGPLNVREGVNVSPRGGMPPSVVKGELLRIDGKDYVVKDQLGQEIRFQLDERTRMDAYPKIGDRISANVEPQGYAYSIDRAGH